MNPQPAYSNLSLKVCGLTKTEQIQELMTMKVDFLGFIFYEKSPRYVLNHLSLDDISKVDHQGKVGVFVNEITEKIIEVAEKGKLNLIQLHGDESEDFMADLRKKLNPEIKIIKVIRIGNDTTENRNKITQILNDQSTSYNLPPVTYYLFDTDSKAFGGTGQQFDWNLLNEFEIPLPYFLSGGISEENITNIQSLIQKPFAIDINSKFEINPGDKDIERIKKFSSTIQKSPNGAI
ncbi:phosphoribosylanthranilate isomerase [Chryseobacterium sp. G0186]|uniref:phosphoribosylanthranilate isomerase n=1 Tax=Chryseobacterium sp. G0186 TaxID=2487064 RepID=UPI000F4DEA63|nr:phosphoribosylanthranilate isomerase [Chryseobacterium sp. G0186]AZA80047.1 phosphoribosylanthranilate isomerase [Chryseobacterium sp. G0186]